MLACYRAHVLGIPSIRVGAQTRLPESGKQPSRLALVGRLRLVVFQIDNLQGANVNVDVFFSITMLLLFPIVPSVDLGAFGMPGCWLHIASVDSTLPLVGSQPNKTTALPLLLGIPAGVQLLAQWAALVSPNSLPNAQNASGAVIRNGVRSFAKTF